MTSAQHTLAPLSALTCSRLHGDITVPGDKSISHRALMLGSQVLGRVRLSGLLEGEDVLHTAEALRACGVAITREAEGRWVVDGVGVLGLSEPTRVLDMGNSGTGVRLMMGLLAPYPFAALFTGDESLCKRPMQRVTVPLSQLGAQFVTREGGRLPLTFLGNPQPLPIHYTLPVASAQVKSAVLLAALSIPGVTTVVEKEATRDHTERMMRYFGFAVDTDLAAEGTVIRLHGLPTQKRRDHELHIPADPSSAAFAVVAALIVPGSEIIVRNVCVNPLRIGLFTTLIEMGADLHYENMREEAGEPVADIRVRYSKLRGVTIPADRAPSMIDEYPILSVAAAFAKGETIMQGLAELRVKESNRFNAILDGLRANGVVCEEKGDTLSVKGNGTPPRGSGKVVTHYDHRIAMSFLVMGMASTNPVTVDDTRAIATSFPGFVPLMQKLGAVFDTPSALPRRHGKLVIAVDGPAASGKGTLARRLADYFALPYLDTGSLYRATAMRLVYGGGEVSHVEAAVNAANAIQPHDLSNPKLRQEHIGQTASIVSSYPEVRDALLEYQRNFATQNDGAVLDGRDIGTVVCPDADIKIFVTASVETRAERRLRELLGEGIDITLEAVREDLERRDVRDSARSIAPLVPAEDAIVIDTDGLSANEVFELTIALIKPRLVAA
jgi:3-phosphoshikimate 1-carboxyvinyltransferase